MTISINKEIAEKHEITIQELLVLLAIANGTHFKNTIEDLLQKGYIGECFVDGSYNGSYFITRAIASKISSIILESDQVVGKSSFIERVDNLVPKLQECFPTGKKEGTDKYWRGNKTDIRKKLLSFFKRYEDSYTDDQIIEATRNYVSSFNGQYRFMRVLQYFIWKDEVKDGERVSSSDLASYIENSSQTETLREDWNTSIV